MATTNAMTNVILLNTTSKIDQSIGKNANNDALIIIKIRDMSNIHTDKRIFVKFFILNLLLCLKCDA